MNRLRVAAMTQSALIVELQTLLEPGKVLTDADSLTTYGKDWTKHFAPAPLAIVFPETIEQVQALCVEKRYPDPQGLAFRFFNFYAPDWKTGKGKRAKIMDSWPMALAGWVSRDNGVFRVPEFADIQKYLTENCAKAGLDIDFVATQFLNKGTKEGWKGIRNWKAMLKQYVNTIVCSKKNKK